MGRIQVSDDLCKRLQDDFVFERRGAIMLKGKGALEAHFLVDEA